MKRQTLFTLLENLNKLDNLTGVKFNWVIDRNREQLEKETKDIMKVSEPSEKFQEYDKKRIEILQKYSEKDDNGNPKFTQTNQGMVRFDINDKNMKKFQKEIDALTKEFEKEIKDRDKQLFEYDKFLNEEVTPEFEMLTLEDIDEGITGEQFKVVTAFLPK